MRIFGASIACALSAVLVMSVPTSRADPHQDQTIGSLPTDEDIIVPLPVVTPTPLAWRPKFNFPYEQTAGDVSDADIVAMGEMCQWFNAQYDTLRRQIDRVQFNRITPNGPGVISGSGSDWDYSADGIQEQVDIVTNNIDQTVDFLTPRVNALTRSQDYAGDFYFPIYEGKSFYLVWQDLSNASEGLKAHQPAWFTGAPILQFKRYGSRIARSHVCD
jgi:hypothetical protein